MNVRLPVAAGGLAQTFQVVLVRKKGGATSGRVDRDQGDGALSTTCTGLASTWDNQLDRIDVTVPWKCLRTLRAAMRVQGYFGAGKPNTGDPDDFLRTVKVGYR